MKTGGGVIGVTTAYYMTRHPKFNPALQTITLLEATSTIAAGASGKAGGLLGMWAYPECLVPLSYRLHRELAEQHGGHERWGYRTLECGSLKAVVTKVDLEARRTAVDKENGCTSGTEQQPSTAHIPPPPPPPPEPIQASAPTSAPSQAYTNAVFQIADLDEDDDFLKADKKKNSIVPKPGEDKEKEWEKLPKQDPSATICNSSSPLPPDLDWIDRSLVQSYAQMGRVPDFTATAQVHPLHFTTAMASLAASAGVEIRLNAKATSISGGNVVKRIDYEDRSDPQHPPIIKSIDDVTDVIVAAGPWTGRLLPRSKIEGLRAHSVVYEADLSPYAVFTEIQLPSDYIPAHRQARGQRRRHRGPVDPEVYARPFGEAYACGEPDKSVPLPDTADQVTVDEAQCDDLTAYLATVSPQLAAAPVKARQACYMPQHVRFGTERGPLIGPTSIPRVWIAAGHTCWGIQNAPATGVLMAEWVFDGAARAVDAEVLHPGKFKV